MLIPVACSNGDFSLKKDAPLFRAPKEVFTCLQEGDIVLRQGLGPFSSDIVYFLAEKHPFSHCGIIINNNNKPLVVHSISAELSGIDGMQTQSVDDFFSDVADSNAAIVRPVFTDEQKTRFILATKRCLENKIPFDHGFDLADSSALSCSEFVYHAYISATKKNPFEVKKAGKQDFVKFDSFFKTDYFTLVWKAKKN